MKSRAEQLADVIGGYIDEPRGTAPGLGNPTNPEDPRFGHFAEQMSNGMGVPFTQGQHSPTQFGETYNPEEYRGLRFVLPESFPDDGRAGTDTRPGARVPDYDAINQEFRGHMITRGYPVYGGNGQLPGFRKGFNPVGFGQRDNPIRERMSR